MNRSYKVLVIDDSPFVLKAVKKALEPEGYQMLEQAFNGKMGLELVAQLQPDIIFLDITMPEMDGLQTAEQLLRRDPRAKIIMLSAMGDKELLQKANQIGVKLFIAKPFKSDDIVKSVESILNGQI